MTPFLKWAGGKRRLLPALLPHLPASFGVYHEPFVGAGALFFALQAAGRLTRSHLSDINAPLVDAYHGVRDEVDAVIHLLRAWPRTREMHLYLRALAPHTLPLAARAARMIFLSRNGYNGIYRENKAGRCNVPWGNHPRSRPYDGGALCASSRALQGVAVACCPFETVADRARPGDLVYFDPPYDPTSATASFRSYDRSGFGPDDQHRLRDVGEQLALRGVHVVTSSSDTPLIRDLYREWKITEVSVLRSIASKATSRGKATELISSPRGRR